jgi:hypothetical protein
MWSFTWQLRAEEHDIATLECRRGLAWQSRDGVTSPQLRESILCPLGNSWVLYYPMTDRLLILNETAKIVWDFKSQGYEAREIAGALALHFGISDKQAAQDVAKLLADLSDVDTRDDYEGADIRLADPSHTDAPSVSGNRVVDCGVFRFGESRIRVMSSLKELDESSFLRYQHRAIGNSKGADVLLIEGCAPAYRLTFHGQILAESKMLNQLTRQLAELFLGLEHPGKRLLALFHAAAVSRAGRSLLMPGSSGVGKSTLTGFLAAHDFAYLGDDLIGIGEDGMDILPQPTCLSIKAGAWTILEPFYPTLSKLATVNRYGRRMRFVNPQGNYTSLQAGPAPSAIIFPAYSAEKPTRLTPLPPIQTMIQLLDAHACLSGSDVATADQLSRFVRFVEQTPAYELSYSELPSAMKTIEALLASQP